jgi:acylphosphatase
MSDVAVSVHVVGQVQGVGFRWSCREEAERLGVRGWVRNEPDGSVAGLFEGDRDAVDALVGWCRAGSSWASVDRVDVESAEPSGAKALEIRF